MQHPSLMNRRMAGVLNARLPEAKLQDVTDPRDRRGRGEGVSAAFRHRARGIGRAFLARRPIYPQPSGAGRRICRRRAR